jgi:aryl-alcohol dehydrogenase-like predicted oxidoreductase
LDGLWSHDNVARLESGHLGTDRFDDAEELVINPVAGLGCGPRSVGHRSLPQMQARSTRTTALELGITFWDAANVYGFGTSERSSAGDQGVHPREDIVRATKALRHWRSTTNFGDPPPPHPSLRYTWRTRRCSAG